MKPKISICCLCYNHEKYLKTALDSFYSQKGNFEIEIIIFDDCSTDKSREIIEEYKLLYPGTIKSIYPKENVYSQGRTAFFDIVEATSGEYLAFCEGDDYWCDNFKLAKQLGFLIKNKNLNLVFHPAETLFDSGELTDKGYGYYGDKEAIHGFKDILSISGSYMPMASIFARKNTFVLWFQQYPSFFSCNTWHSTIQILGAYKQGAGYLPYKMCIYRSMHEGSWSHTISSSGAAVEKDYKSFLLRNRGLKNMMSSEFEQVFDSILISRAYKLSKNRFLTLKSKNKLLNLTPYKFSFRSKTKLLIYKVLSGILKHVKK